jgi:hypothetical protein
LNEVACSDGRYAWAPSKIFLSQNNGNSIGPVMIKDQVDSFRATAKAADCDLSEKAFDRALGKIGKAKPEPAKPARRKPKQ